MLGREVRTLSTRKVRGTYTVEKSHRWRYYLNTCRKIESARYCAIYWKNKTIRTQATAATQRACSLSYQRGGRGSKILKIMRTYLMEAPELEHITLMKVKFISETKYSQYML